MRRRSYPFPAEEMPNSYHQAEGPRQASGFAHSGLKRANLYLKLLPLALFSQETRQQLSRKEIHFPDVRTHIHVLRYRNWGADISLALTEKFSVQLDLVFPGVHPELEACAKGGRVADSYYKNWQTLAGLGDTFITERRQRTEQLLKQSPQDLFSEVQIAASGELKIRDGHHRAGLARLHGLKNHNVVVTVKVDLS